MMPPKLWAIKKSGRRQSCSVTVVSLCFPRVVARASNLWLQPHLLCVPDFSNFLKKLPPVIHDGVGATTLQLRVVAVDHGAATWQIFAQEVAQPHASEVALAPPRTVCVPIEAGDGNDTRRTTSAAGQYLGNNGMA
jgi:hypothetical protein